MSLRNVQLDSESNMHERYDQRKGAKPKQVEPLVAVQFCDSEGRVVRHYLQLAWANSYLDVGHEQQRQDYRYNR